MLVLELCREHGSVLLRSIIGDRSMGGMEASMVSRMKELEEENRRLKKMYAEA